MRNDYTDPAETIRRGMRAVLQATFKAYRDSPIRFFALSFFLNPTEIRALSPDQREAVLRMVKQTGYLVSPDQLQALYDIGLERPGDEA